MEEEEEQSLLILSLTINACTLCYFLAGKIVGCAVKRWRHSSPVALALADLHDRQPWLAGKVVTEQLAAFVLVAVSLSALGGTSVATLPFRARRQEPDDSLLQQILAMNIGRFLYMALQDALLHSHLRNFRVDLIHHLVATSAYVVFLTYRENLFLSVTGAFMELNLLPLEVARLMRRAGLGRESAVYRGVTLACFLTTLLSRGLLPLLFLSVALSRQSPFKMNYPPLTVFFLCAVFVSAINLWMVYRTLHRFLRVTSCAQPAETDAENAGNVWTDLTDAAFRETSSVSARNLKLSRLNYGLLRSYDNRNLCSSDPCSEKINLANRKTLAKELLLGEGQHRNNASVVSEVDLGEPTSSGDVTSRSDVALEGERRPSPARPASLTSSSGEAEDHAHDDQESSSPTEHCRLITQDNSVAFSTRSKGIPLSPLNLRDLSRKNLSRSRQWLSQPPEEEVRLHLPSSRRSLLEPASSRSPSPSPSLETVVPLPASHPDPPGQTRDSPPRTAEGASGGAGAKSPVVRGKEELKLRGDKIHLPPPPNVVKSRDFLPANAERRPGLLRTRSAGTGLCLSGEDDYRPSSKRV